MALANYGTIAVSIPTTVLLTTQVSEADYGTYRYVINVAMMLVSFSNFGVYYSTARILTTADRERSRLLYSATAIILLGIVTIVSCLIVVAYPAIAGIFSQVDTGVLWALPLFPMLMLQRMFVSMLKGSNQITHVAIQTVLPSVLALLAYLGIWLFGSGLSVVSALVVYFGSYFLTHTLTARALRLRCDPAVKSEIAAIWREQRSTGIELYKGSLLAVFAADVITVLAGTMLPKASYGEYALALSAASPMMMIPAMFGVIRFKDSASRNCISRRELLMVGALGLLSLAALNLLITVVFGVLYDSAYVDTPALARLLSVGYAFHGLGDYLNNFLSSHGQGQKVKLASYVSGVLLIMTAVLMIPAWGIWGLASSRALGSFAYFLAMYYGYVKFYRGTHTRGGALRESE